MRASRQIVATHRRDVRILETAFRKRASSDDPGKLVRQRQDAGKITLIANSFLIATKGPNRRKFARLI
jgi:hypothetical protein